MPETGGRFCFGFLKPEMDFLFLEWGEEASTASAVAWVTEDTNAGAFPEDFESADERTTFDACFFC